MGGNLRTLAIVATALLAGACSETPDRVAEPTSSPTASIFLEDRERPKVEQAYEDFVSAFEEEDWAATVSLMSEDALRFFAELRKAAADAGAAELLGLDTYRLLAATVLRAAEGPSAVGVMSYEDLVAALARYDLLGNRGALDLELTEPIRVFGDSAAVFVPQGGGAAWEIDFHYEGERWKVDVSDIARIAGDSFEDLVRRRGQRLRKMILEAAEVLAGSSLTAEIWAKP